MKTAKILPHYLNFLNCMKVLPLKKMTLNIWSAPLKAIYRHAFIGIHSGLYEALYEYCLRINNPELQLFGERIDWDNAKAIIELSKNYSQRDSVNFSGNHLKILKKQNFVFESLKEILKTENPFNVKNIV